MKLVASLLVLALLAGAVLTLWRASARETAAEAAYPPEGQFVTVEGTRLHAVIAGSGPDVVLIHGASGSLRDMTFDLLPALAARYRVIAIDRPGFGWSEPAEGAEHIDVQARLIQKAAAALGATRPIVLGHSYGGAVALAWATGAPDTLSALVLVSAPSHTWTTPLPRLYAVTSNPWLGPLAIPLIAAWTPTSIVERETAAVFLPQAMPGDYMRHFGPEMALRRGLLDINARQRAVLLDDIKAMIPAYPSLALPVEAVHGDADTTVGLEIHAGKLARDVPGLNLVPLPGIGHMPHHVAMEAVIAAVDRAASRAAASARP